MTTSTKKTIGIAAVIAFIVYLFSKRTSKASIIDVDVLVGVGNIPQGHEPELFLIQNFSWENERFEFSTPLGSFVLENPDTSTAAYNSFDSNAEYEFGWQAPTPGIIVITLLPKTTAPVVTNIVLDLEQETVNFEYVQLD